MEKNIFNVLREIEKNGIAAGKAGKVAKACHISEREVKKIIQNLKEKGYIQINSSYSITKYGREYLGQFRADFAVIMAAGGGNRLNPVTLETPKPLVKVWGKPMIETMIEALRLVGIDEIYVVTGYKAEMFAYLPDKYDNLKLLYNNNYEGTNNSSTVYAAVELMKRGKNFYICESDQVVRDPEIFYRYVNQNQYMAKYIPGKTDEWTFELDENKRINRIKIGGEDAFNMVGITFWLSETGAYLAGVLDELYKNPVESGKLHWDNILDMNLYKLDMGIQEVYPEQIFEIDTFDELKRADPTYDTFHSV